MIDLEIFQRIMEGQKRYRRKQALRSLCQDCLSDWGEATALPVDLREELNRACPLDITAKFFPSRDGRTIKALIRLSDGQKVETVLMRHLDGRNTVCVSSQAGCPMGCVFCATGAMGFRRNLTPGEIISQVLVFCRVLKKQAAAVTNVVYMGMGEPFNNYGNVLASIRMLNDPDGFKIGARRMAVSTCCIVPGIERFATEKLQVNLAISLHAPNDKLRSKLMPINRRYPIGEVLAAVDRYVAVTSRRVMFEYVMIGGINDSERDAQELARLLKKPLYLVNIIKYNETGKYHPSSALATEKFIKILQQAGIPVTERYRFGHDIAAACGQLANKQKQK